VSIRVLIVDDQDLVRLGFRLILEREPDLDVVGEAANGIQALERVAEVTPDVVLMVHR
jgi:DNA-binding NarL/FixJ family response regulator